MAAENSTTGARPASTAGALDAPVTSLRGVGAALAERLERLGIQRVRDLLFHLPHRYEDRTRLTPIGAARPGVHVVVEGTIAAADVVFGRRRSLLARLQDGTGLVSLRLFHFSRAQQEQLKPGARVRCFGEVRTGASGPELYHPEYRVLDERPPPMPDRLTPVYPVTEGVGQARIRSLCASALSILGREPGDLAGDLADALVLLHAPLPDVSLADLESGRHPAQQRLAADELLAHHLSLLRARRHARSLLATPLPAPAAGTPTNLRAPFLASLPFALTAAQRRVIDEIDADLAAAVPTMRLIQGDVGSGKTVVAAAAAMRAAEHGCQTALMAPTELLAEQHFRTLSEWLTPLGLGTALVTGRLRAAERRRQQAAVATGQATLVVGTHALFQSDMEFCDLALVIIDEQHRFGVHQRLALREKGARDGDATGRGGRRDAPHQLVMTATPIPRTLAMSAYADLDLSVLDELPPGRTPVTTVVIGAERRAEVIERVSMACRSGRQAYWVCTLIDESEALQAEAAEATAELLTEELSDLRIALVHGRLKPDDKAAVMAAFESGEVDLLVATTVIEVGVNVPNASLMVIENAERLGLAQLHQLRGRVGRGAVESHCVLMYQPPLSRGGRERLGVLRASNDGFRIAEKDLELRGPGEILGTRQTGLVDLRIADLVRDRDLLPEVQRRARQLMDTDPEGAEQVIDRWLGGRERYADA
ncbi:MAG TPA: ATP-dependent DNA helicase RecG [Pseudomonadales bacterium]|nr:ATP-dependent DNA helicase RecG [Pseudomonadales bacterium]